MFQWKMKNQRKRDLILINPESVDIEKIENIYYDLKMYWESYEEEISKEIISGLISFYEAIMKKNDYVVFSFRAICLIYRWLKTEGNFKYDDPQFDGWKDALKALWQYLFGTNYKEFYQYEGNGQYIINEDEWEDWYRSIGGT